MNAVPILTKDELEAPRTAADMLAWVDSAHARFNTKELKGEARKGKHFARELVDEARPIALFAMRYYDASKEVTISYLVGDQNHDAVVTDNRKNAEPYKYLEVTTTMMTYEDSLRLEALTERGSVPAYGRVTREGSRHKGAEIKADEYLQEHEEIVVKHLRLVEDAVRRKAKKKYEPNTVLIVAIDDSVPFREQADVNRLNELATQTLVPALGGTNFSMLALAGSNHVHLIYRL